MVRQSREVCEEGESFFEKRETGNERRLRNED